MAASRKNFITTLVAIITWLFFRRNNPQPTIILPERDVEYILLTPSTLHKLDRGFWYIIVGDAVDVSDVLGEEAGEILCQSKDVDFGVAILKICDFGTAEIAARLGIQNAGEILVYSQGEIITGQGCRHIRSATSIFDITDYYLFFTIFDMKKALESTRCYENIIETCPYLIGKMVSRFC